MAIAPPSGPAQGSDDSEQRARRRASERQRRHRDLAARGGHERARPGRAGTDDRCRGGHRSIEEEIALYESETAHGLTPDPQAQRPPVARGGAAARTPGQPARGGQGLHPVADRRPHAAGEHLGAVPAVLRAGRLGEPAAAAGRGAAFRTAAHGLRPGRRPGREGAAAGGSPGARGGCPRRLPVGAGAGSHAPGGAAGAAAGGAAGGAEARPRWRRRCGGWCRWPTTRPCGRCSRWSWRGWSAARWPRGATRSG